MKKRITAILLTSLVVLLSACTGRINISDSEPIDNAFGNEYANGSEVEDGLWRTKDTLYIRRIIQEQDLNGSTYATQSIYKLTDAGQEQIYSGKTEQDFSADMQMRLYHGEFLDYYLHADTELDHPEIWRLNQDRGQFEKYIELAPPNGSVPYRFFVLEDQLYFISSSEQEEPEDHVYSYDELENHEDYVYRYDDGTYTLLASNETFGHMFLPLYFYKHYMYYVLPESIEQITDDNFYTYYVFDLESKKTVREIRMDMLEELDQSSKGTCNDIIFTDHYVYFNYLFAEDTFTLYRTDLSDMKTTKIVDNSGCRMNTCGDTLYLAFTPKITPDTVSTVRTLHILTPETDTPQEICTMDINNLYLVDDKWVYFTDFNNTIYRIMSTGENLQKVM